MALHRSALFLAATFADAFATCLPRDKPALPSAVCNRLAASPLLSAAPPPEAAEPLYEAFCGFLRELGVHVETGRFRAEMTVDVSGDGPVTFVLDEPFM